MRIALAALLTIVLALVAILGFVYSGLYDVAATQPHTALTSWVLQTTMEQSVRTRARHIQVPASFPASMSKDGFKHYAENCVSCHGAPGVERGEIGKGIMPTAPDLAKKGSRWNSAELFWIIKNGVRMTAMPAWGRTHSDDEIWTLIAFLQQLPALSPEQYEALRQEAFPRPEPSLHEHRHRGAHH